MNLEFRKSLRRRRTNVATPPSVERDVNAEISLKGWLYRLEGSPLKHWKKRWCVLAQRALFVYKDEDEQKLLASFCLPGYTVRVCTSHDHVSHKNAFVAEQHSLKAYYLAADSNAAMCQWRNSMAQAATGAGEPPPRSPRQSQPAQQVPQGVPPPAQLLLPPRPPPGSGDRDLGPPAAGQDAVALQNGRHDFYDRDYFGRYVDMNNMTCVTHSPIYANAPPKPKRAPQLNNRPRSADFLSHPDEHGNLYGPSPRRAMRPHTSMRLYDPGYEPSISHNGSNNNNIDNNRIAHYHQNHNNNENNNENGTSAYYDQGRSQGLSTHNARLPGVAASPRPKSCLAEPIRFSASAFSDQVDGFESGTAVTHSMHSLQNGSSSVNHHHHHNDTNNSHSNQPPQAATDPRCMSLATFIDNPHDIYGSLQPLPCHPSPLPPYQAPSNGLLHTTTASAAARRAASLAHHHDGRFSSPSSTSASSTPPPPPPGPQAGPAGNRGPPEYLHDPRGSFRARSVHNVTAFQNSAECYDPPQVEASSLAAHSMNSLNRSYMAAPSIRTHRSGVLQSDVRSSLRLRVEPRSNQQQQQQDQQEQVRQQQQFQHHHNTLLVPSAMPRSSNDILFPEQPIPAATASAEGPAAAAATATTATHISTGESRSHRPTNHGTQLSSPPPKKPPSGRTMSTSSYTSTHYGEEIQPSKLEVYRQVPQPSYSTQRPVSGVPPLSTQFQQRDAVADRRDFSLQSMASRDLQSLQSLTDSQYSTGPPESSLPSLESNSSDLHTPSPVQHFTNLPPHQLQASEQNHRLPEPRAAAPPRYSEACLRSEFVQKLSVAPSAKVDQSRSVNAMPAYRRLDTAKVAPAPRTLPQQQDRCPLTPTRMPNSRKLLFDQLNCSPVKTPLVEKDQPNDPYSYGRDDLLKASQLFYSGKIAARTNEQPPAPIECRNPVALDLSFQSSSHNSVFENETPSAQGQQGLLAACPPEPRPTLAQMDRVNYAILKQEFEGAKVMARCEATHNLAPAACFDVRSSSRSVSSNESSRESRSSLSSILRANVSQEQSRGQTTDRVDDVGKAPASPTVQTLEDAAPRQGTVSEKLAFFEAKKSPEPSRPKSAMSTASGGTGTGRPVPDLIDELRLECGPRSNRIPMANYVSSASSEDILKAITASKHQRSLSLLEGPAPDVVPAQTPPYYYSDLSLSAQSSVSRDSLQSKTRDAAPPMYASHSALSTRKDTTLSSANYRALEQSNNITDGHDHSTQSLVDLHTRKAASQPTQQQQQPTKSRQVIAAARREANLPKQNSGATSGNAKKQSWSCENLLKKQSLTVPEATMSATCLLESEPFYENIGFGCKASAIQGPEPQSSPAKISFLAVSSAEAAHRRKPATASVDEPFTSSAHSATSPSTSPAHITAEAGTQGITHKHFRIGVPLAAPTTTTTTTTTPTPAVSADCRNAQDECVVLPGDEEKRDAVAAPAPAAAARPQDLQNNHDLQNDHDLQDEHDLQDNHDLQEYPTLRLSSQSQSASSAAVLAGSLGPPDLVQSTLNSSGEAGEHGDEIFAQIMNSIGCPSKIDIPERYVSESDSDADFSAVERLARYHKADTIRRRLAGQFRDQAGRLTMNQVIARQAKHVSKIVATQQ